MQRQHTSMAFHISPWRLRRRIRRREVPKQTRNMDPIGLCTLTQLITTITLRHHCCRPTFQLSTLLGIAAKDANDKRWKRPKAELQVTNAISLQNQQNHRKRGKKRKQQVMIQQETGCFGGKSDSAMRRPSIVSSPRSFKAPRA
jgi:hypothetical protein